MSDNTGISWTDATWNPVVGCTPVSAGCLNCYAARLAGTRLAHTEKYAGLTVTRPDGKRKRFVFNGEVRTVERALEAPLRWRKPRRIFVNSESDLFHEAVPFEFVDRVFAVMALCPQHTFQVLTKRPERMAEYLAEPSRQDRRIDVANAATDLGGWKGSHKGWTPVAGRAGFYLPPWPLPNVWLGTSCEDQKTADERIPHLMRCPAAVRFISAEPLLSEIKLPFETISQVRCRLGIGYTAASRHVEANRIHWIIAGGESGPGARPCDVAWIRSIVRQCRDAGVSAFVKQLGACVEMTFEEWNDLTGGGLFGSDKFTLLFDGCDRGFWRCVDRKGGDPAEWPEDLRVQELPLVRRKDQVAR